MVAEQLGSNTKEQMSHASSDVNQHGSSTQSDENRAITHEALNCSLETFDAARSLLKAQRFATELKSQKIHDLGGESVALKDHDRDVGSRSEYITPSSIQIGSAKQVILSCKNGGFTSDSIKQTKFLIENQLPLTESAMNEKSIPAAICRVSSLQTTQCSSQIGGEIMKSDACSKSASRTGQDDRSSSQKI